MLQEMLEGRVGFPAVIGMPIAVCQDDQERARPAKGRIWSPRCRVLRPGNVRSVRAKNRVTRLDAADDDAMIFHLAGVFVSPGRFETSDAIEKLIDVFCTPAPFAVADDIGLPACHLQPESAKLGPYRPSARKIRPVAAPPGCPRRSRTASGRGREPD